MVTLKEIAAHCGCSVAAVSKALNGRPDINPQTARRIREVAKDMGYLPNIAARMLKTNASKTIALLFFLKESIWQHSHFSAIAASIQATTEQYGYDITPVNCYGESIANSYLDYCRHRKYDGVIVMSVTKDAPDLMDFISSDIPLVTIDSAYENRNAVISDNFAGMRELVHYAHKRGHRQMAFIHGEATFVNEQRLKGFHTACRELGLTIPNHYIQPARHCDVELTGKVSAKLLSLSEPPTCIFAPDDYAALGVVNECNARKLRIPEDVSVIGYDGIHLTRVLRPRLTTLRQDVEGLGTLAAKMVIKSIGNAQAEPRHALLPGWIVEGESVLDLSAHRV